MGLRSDRGFALIEAAIALAVMGIFLGIFIPTVSTLRSYSSSYQDQQKYDRICCAIAAYVIRNSHLPTPAKDPDSGECSSNGSDIGFIPFKAIGLSRELSINSRGNPIKYIPNKDLVETTSLYSPAGSLLEKDFKCEFCGRFEANSLNLDVINSYGQSIIDKESNSSSINPIAFVLFVDDKSIQLTEGDVVTVRMLKKESPSMRCVFRDDLMSYYARHPCPPTK